MSTLERGRCDRGVQAGVHDGAHEGVHDGVRDGMNSSALDGVHGCARDVVAALARPLAGAFAAAALMLVSLASALAAEPASPRLGRPVGTEQARASALTVFPDGRGLPPGRGTAVEGAPLFKQHCALCHGEAGRGASAEELAGGTEPLTSAYPDKTIGLYWPYATTLFDLTRRSMPMFAPGSLSASEVYAITAYLLSANGVIGERDEMNASSLPRVRMPNRDGFVGVDAAAQRAP